mgnify:FL=1
MPPISVMIKPASGLCNMKCDYCFYSDEAKKRTCETYGYMTEQTLKNVIRKTIRSAEYYVNYAFQGGEPTLRGIEFFEKAVKFQEKFNKHGIAVNNSIQTNGYNINEDWCKFLKNNNFLVGYQLMEPNIHMIFTDMIRTEPQLLIELKKQLSLCQNIVLNTIF